MDELITKQLSGEASAEEAQQVMSWVALRPENALHYQKMKKAFDISAQHYARPSTPESLIDVDAEWNRFVRTVSKKETPVKSLTPFYASTWVRIAAALLILVASGIVFNYYASRNSELKFQTSEETLAVSLPDGSTVTLNKNSQLTYPRGFDRKTRSVTLQGEAFFEVARNPQKPFIISVNNAKVEVLGTSFNVQGYNERQAVEVTVATGVVRFSVPSEEQEVTLKAGERGVFIKSARQLSSVANKDINFLSWNTKKIVFEETDLRSVIETLNNTYQVNIIIATEIPPSCVVTVSFDHQTLEAVLNVLKSTLNLTYKINGDTIEITSAGC